MSTPSLGISHVVSSQDAKEITANAAFDTLDKSVNGFVAVAMADANVTLTQAQLAAGFVFNCTGANSATRNLIVPATSRFFTVINSTTGGFGVLAKTPSGTGITVTTAMGATLLFCDGTNVISLGASGGGGGGGTWVAEVPTGTIDGTNATFTVSHTPNPVASFALLKNGNEQDPGGGDYTLTGATIVYAAGSIPQPVSGSDPADKHRARYQY